MKFIKEEDILVMILTAVSFLGAFFTKDDPAHALVFGILCSVIASGIFYITQIVVPRVENTRKALNLFTRRIERLYDTIATFNAIAKEFIRVRDDSVIINGFGANGGIIYYRIIRKEKTNIQEYKNICNYLFGFTNQLKQLAKNIEDSRVSAYLPDGFLEQIDSILVNDLSMIGALGEGYPDCSKYTGIEKDLTSMKKYEDRIAPFVRKPSVLKVEKLTEEEIATYKRTLGTAKGFLETMNIKARERRALRNKGPA